jgi:glycosyltransferase involved in cell wall biosynthesis
MIKIAYILDVYPHGQTHIVNELIALENKGIDVHIVALRTPGKEDVIRVKHESIFPVTYMSHDYDEYSWISFFKDNIICCFMHPLRYLTNVLLSLKWIGENFKNAARFTMIFEKIKPDLVYVNWSWCTCGSVMYACRILGLPFIFSVQGTDILPPARNFSLRVSTAKTIITPSVGYEEILKQKLSVPPSKIRVVPHALSLKNIQRLPSSRLKITDRLRLLCLSTLRPVKRLEDLIDACAVLRNRNIDFECRIFGEGPDRNSLTSQIKSLCLEDYVKLLGHVPQEELVSQFEWCDIYTHTSESESFCFAVVEAQAAGRPVVAVDAFGGLRQSVRDGETAILVPPRNPQCLAEKIIFLYNHPDQRLQMGLAGKKYVWGKFNMDVFQNNFITALLDNFEVIS